MTVLAAALSFTFGCGGGEWEGSEEFQEQETVEAQEQVFQTEITPGSYTHNEIFSRQSETTAKPLAVSDYCDRVDDMITQQDESLSKFEKQLNEQLTIWVKEAKTEIPKLNRAEGKEYLDEFKDDVETYRDSYEYDVTAAFKQLWKDINEQCPYLDDVSRKSLEKELQTKESQAIVRIRTRASRTIQKVTAMVK